MAKPSPLALLLLLALASVAGAMPHLVDPNEPPALVEQSPAVDSEVLEDSDARVCHGPEDCNNHGICDTNSMCRCAPGWGGVDCSVEFTCPNQCSNNGVCRAHTCFCHHGYTGRDCSIELFCPNNCNGNGRCDRGICVCDAGFDGADCSQEVGCAYKCVHGRCADQVCLCDEGYHGVDCSEIDYCMTNCSNHGTCKDRRCICDFGFTGVVCSTAIPCPNRCSHKGECVNGTCMCDLGFTGVDCSEDCCPDQNSQCLAGKMCSYPPCHCHNDCNDNGICHRGRCICRQGYFGEDCSSKYCPQNCSMHGSCDHAVGECTCDAGWKGNACDEVECPNDCNNRGECMLFGGESRICLCEEGYTGSDCGEEVPCPGDCSGHGLCRLGNCLCENGWDGPDCSDEVEPWVPCERDCYGHGTCQDGVCVECDEGWQGKFCHEQKIVELKEDGTIKCPGEPECSSHGLCGPGGKCFCTEEWLGADCAIKKCPDDCNGRGECRGGRCMCHEPYHSGPMESCEFIHCPSNCSGPTHGNCNKETGQCACIPPWATDDCSQQPCPGEPECSEHGQCDHDTGVCDCLPDYSGEDCGTYMRCPNDCSGNGVCFKGECYCYSNFTGESCRAVKRPPPPPGYDWKAPLRAAQALFSTSRTVSPPMSPEPASFSINQKKDLFKEAYGEDWLRQWNLVHQNPRTLRAFVDAVTSQAPNPESEESLTALRDTQLNLFKQVFGEEDSEDAWARIMEDSDVKQRFFEMFKLPAGTESFSEEVESRGHGLPPPPPIARDELVTAPRQRLFVDTFGAGEGLAMEMLIFGNRTKRDLFTTAFSDFLKENMSRNVQDKRDNWEDDMMQLMTDALGSDGPSLLRQIYADPKRSKLFRDAFAGYLEQTPVAVPALLQTDEGQGAALAHNTLKSSSHATRNVPTPV